MLDNDFLLEATVSNPKLAQHLDCSKTFLLAAVARNLEVLDHAPQEYKNDAEFIKSCVQQNGLALQHAGGALRQNKDIVIAAMTQSAAAFAYSHQALHADPDVLTCCIQHATDEERLIVATALQKHLLKSVHCSIFRCLIQFRLFSTSETQEKEIAFLSASKAKEGRASREMRGGRQA